MKTVWALFVGEQVIEKSTTRKDLIALRDTPEMKKKGAYISVWIGRIDINTMQVVDNKKKEE